MQISNPSPHLHEISISNETKLDQQIKLNLRTITKLNISPLNHALHYGPYLINIRDIQNTIASMLHQEKLLSSFISPEFPVDPKQMTFMVSKLKNLKNITSLELQSLRFCTLRFFKYLSIILSQLKKLTSLTLFVPSALTMTPKHVANLFFALERLKNLTSFSLNLDRAELDVKSYQTLTTYLSKLTQLKSFTISLISTENLTPSFFSFLAPSFKKLLMLEKLNVVLSNPRSIEGQALIDFFTGLKGLKSLKSLALDLRRSIITMTDSHPISKGLSLVNPDSLQSFDFRSSSNLDDQSIHELGITLQRFPSLRELTLDFADNHKISDIGFQKLSQSLQTLRKLTSLNMGFFKFSSISFGPVGMIAPTIKPLLNLKSLYLDLNGHPLSNDPELRSFSESLQGLTNLKNLTLKSGQFMNITDEAFVDFSATLKSLTELLTLTLDLSRLAKLTGKGIEGLAFALGNLNKLKELSIYFSGSDYLRKDSTDSLAQALKNLSSLEAISLKFTSCPYLMGEGDKFRAIFKALREMKFLKKIHMTLPSKDFNEKDFQFYTRHILNKTIYWK